VTRLTLIAGTMSAALTAQSCVEQVVVDGGRPRPAPPRPTQPAPAPASAVATQMVFLIGAKPKDSNGNGYPDEFAVTVSLFTQDTQAVYRDGTFTFTLVAPGTIDQSDVEPMDQWTFTSDEANRRRMQSIIGPSYHFALSLAPSGIERVPTMTADMVCTFTPDDGGPEVRCDDVRTIQFGRRSSGF